MSSSEIRGRSFETVRRGYDPVEVDAFLDGVAQDIEAGAATHIGGAKPGIERPIRTDTRVELLNDAKDEIGRIRRMAEASAERTVRDATDESQRTMIDARRDALALMERSRAEADAVVTEARLEQASLEARIIELRQVVRRTEHLLKAMASGALGDVAKADTTLASVGVDPSATLRVELHDPADLKLDASVASDERTGSRDELPDSVDRLLEQLRDIG